MRQVVNLGLQTAVLAVAVTAAASALAQTSTPPTSPGDPATKVSPLTVRPPPQARAPSAQRRIWSFVQSYSSQTAVAGQMSRWEEPVWVEVLGLPRAQGAQVADRILATAQDVGARLGGQNCRPNIQVVFTQKPQALMDLVARRRNTLLGYHYIAQTQSLKTITRPIQSWYVTATRDDQGVEIIDDASGSVNKLNSLHGCGNDAFSLCIRSLFKNILIVVDANQLQDQSLMALSDYASMLALCRPKSLDGCADLPSVLDLYDDRCREARTPTGLTTPDRAYLKALYAADMRHKLSLERDEIALRMASLVTSLDPGPAAGP